MPIFPSSMPTEYTIEDVKKHNKSGDVWLVMNGKVYDVSRFADDHPGGPSTIEDHGGTDATAAFENIGHTDEAIEMAEEYCIGVLVNEAVDKEQKDDIKLEKVGEQCITIKQSAVADTVKNDAAESKQIDSWFSVNISNNSFFWYWIVAVIAVLAFWANAGQSSLTNLHPKYYVDGFNGVFKIVGFNMNSTSYAYRLENPEWYHYIMPWVGYIPHQILALYFMYDTSENVRPKYKKEWRWFNFRMLKLHAIFLIWKFIHNRVFYNGLSSILPLWFGTGTVATMLYVVAVLRIPLRGLVFGTPKRSRFFNELAKYAIKYHGYYILFAIINDFWFHPLEGSPGHLLGVLNDMLILLQSCTLYMKDHRNGLWTLALELIVLPHSGVVSLPRYYYKFDQDPNARLIFGQFTFGYMLIFIVNQMWQLPHGKSSKTYRYGLYTGFTAIFLASTLTYYIYLNIARQMFEVVFLLIMELGIICYYALLYKGCEKVISHLTNEGTRERVVSAVIATVFVIAISWMPFVAIFSM